MTERRIARLPDGTELSFPANTADDVMDRAVEQHVARTRADATARNQNSGVLGYIDSMGRQVAQGAAFGGMDEASAAIRTGAGLWGDYGATLEQERARDRTFQEDRPISSTVANLIGGVLGPGLAIRGARAGAGLLSRVFRSAPVRGIVAGAVGGTATGFGEGQGGLADRAENAVGQGATGAILGGAIGGGAALAGRIGGRVADGLGFRNAETAADRQVLRAFSRDGTTPEELIPRVQAAPEGTIIPDVAGRNTVGLAAVSANTPGRAQEAAEVLTDARRAAAPDRIAGAADEAFGGGSGDDFSRAVTALAEQRSTNARPLYERAWRIELTPDEYNRVAPFVQDSIGQEAMRRGLRVVEIEHLARGETFNPAQYGLRRVNGELVPVEGATPNMRLLDAVKRGFDDIVEGYRDSTTGVLRLDQYGSAVNQARAAYRNTLADMFPPYRRALEAWAGPSASMDAAQRGRQAFRMDRDRLAATEDRITPSDENFLRLGASRALSDMTSDPRTAPGVARRMVEDRQMQARLETLLPDEARRQALIDALQREVRQARVDRTISPNAGSQTARLTASGEDMRIDPMGGVASALVGASRGENLLSALLSRGLLSAYRVGQGMNSSTADAMASRLFVGDRAQNVATLDRLAEQAMRDTQNQQLRQALAARLLQGIGTAQAIEDQSR